MMMTDLKIGDIAYTYHYASPLERSFSPVLLVDFGTFLKVRIISKEKDIYKVKVLVDGRPFPKMRGYQNGKIIELPLKLLALSTPKNDKDFDEGIKLIKKIANISYKNTEIYFSFLERNGFIKKA